MPRAKREMVSVGGLELGPADGSEEHLDQTSETDTLSGAIPEGEDDFLASLAKDLGYRDEEGWERDPAKRLGVKDFLKNTPKVLADAKERGERAAAAAAAAIEDERRRAREEATRVIRESEDPDQRAQAAERLAQNAGPPPETQAWLAKNPWFHTDPDAQALVVATVNRLASLKRPISEQLEEAERVARKRFPEYFAAETEQRLSDVRRQAPQAPQVQQGSRANGATQPKEKGWTDIPRPDREAFDRHLLRAFKSRGLTEDQARAKYAEGYWREGVLPPNEREEDPWVREKKSNPWTRR